jgi:methylmalonyl-CoA mutase
MQKLFTEFNATTAQQWKNQLIKDLKGIDFDTLVWKTNAGLNVQPFYTYETTTQKSPLVFAHNDWAICEYIVVKNEREANAQALNALSNGASGLVFVIDHKIDSAVLLKGISVQHIYTLFKISFEFVEELQNTLKSIECGNQCFIDTDVIAHLAQAGNWNSSHEKDLDSQKSNSTVVVDGRLYQEAGANIINELALTLSHLNDYLAYHSEYNSLPTIKKVHLSVSVGGDFFMEIAKLRALRNLVNFLLNQYELKSEVHIHGQTTSINKSSIDSYTNMLRSTTEAMSASIGGCDSIVVLPFDASFNEPTDFSMRMARNQQLILKEESYLNKVADMAAGSYYIENTTKTLCEEAWQQFKYIESKGGLVESLKANIIQDMIAKDAESLLNQVEEGKMVLVGVNKFQNKAEVIHDVIKETVSKINAKTLINPIKEVRLSESFENVHSN